MKEPTANQDDATHRQRAHEAGTTGVPDRRVRERRRRRLSFAPTTLRSGRHGAPTGHQRAVSDGHQQTDLSAPGNERSATDSALWDIRP
jgi:hypothetical protein